jgi:hypothetical protein
VAIAALQEQAIGRTAHNGELNGRQRELPAWEAALAKIPLATNTPIAVLATVEPVHGWLSDRDRPEGSTDRPYIRAFTIFQPTIGAHIRLLTSAAQVAANPFTARRVEIDAAL